MKNSLKKASLLGLSLLWAFWMIAFINVTNWENSVTIQTSSLPSQHKTRLHSLYLWNGTETTGAWLRVSEWRKNLDFWNGIIVWNSSSSDYVVIGWWENNTVGADNSWIWWWYKNTVNWGNSVIGWWKENISNWTNSVIVWWHLGQSNTNGVVVWWHDGVSDNGGIVLWSNAKANWNSIVLWKDAEWWNWSFAFGSVVWDNSAHINTNFWLLVWRTLTISNVPLVVEWAVKVGMVEPSIVWEIGNSNGCIKSYDGEKNIVWGRISWGSEWGCGWLGSCQFGWMLIQDGDTVFVYSAPYSTNCSSKRSTRTCHDWVLNLDNVYPYCYTITAGTEYKWN